MRWQSRSSARPPIFLGVKMKPRMQLPMPRLKEPSYGSQEPRIQVVNCRDSRPGRCADLLVAIARVGALMVAPHRAWTLRSIPGSGLVMAEHPPTESASALMDVLSRSPGDRREIAFLQHW